MMDPSRKSIRTALRAFAVCLLLAPSSSSIKGGEAEGAQSHIPGSLGGPRSLLDEIAAAVQLSSIFQPTEEQAQKFSQIYPAGAGESTFSLYGNRQNYIVRNGVPYARYWQLEDNTAFVFHPMVMGRHLFKSACCEPIAHLVDSAIDVGVKLPNGGIAWYYPDHYPLSRMRGPGLVYSAISQSEILAGLVHADQLHNGAFKQEVEDALDGLLFDYYRGGVSLHDLAMLEIPLYHSAPEIILNGWLHALLHLNDYTLLYDDHEVARILAKNLAFLADTLEYFNYPENNLSRYSDLSPYRVRVSYEGDAAPNLDALYLARDQRLRNIRVPIRYLDNERSPALYQNQIIRASPGKLDVYVSCAQRFRTLLLGDRGPFRVELESGRYEPKSSSPGKGGTRLQLASFQLGDYHVVDFESVADHLICGYPTNFAKRGGLNYYHVQHIVALIYLSTAAEMDDKTRSALLDWARSWYDALRTFAPAETLSFADPQDVLDGINRGKALTQLREWSTAVRLMSRGK